MSERRIMLLGAALDAGESEQAIERLGRIALPNASKHVVTVGKFDTRKVATAFNVEAGYPAEPAHLQSLAVWAEVSVVTDPRFRDGYDLYCLRKLLAKSADVDFAIIVRDDVSLDAVWPELQTRLQKQLFLILSEEAKGSPAFNLRDPRAAAFLDATWEFYASGAAYAIERYSFGDALTIAADGLRLQASF